MVINKDISHTSLENIVSWVQERNARVKVSIEQCRLDKICEWNFDYTKGMISHKSGKFFTIEGIRIDINDTTKWEQPIINQPEYGILGIIAKPFKGDLYFLMQAKIEPGNVNYVQLSPTIQATRSNYSQVHKGRKPHYLEYFLHADSGSLIYDSLQSEQGSRFISKRNRNMILLLGSDAEVPINEDFIWVSLRQLKQLMKYPNFVNMDTRTVVAGLSHKLYYALIQDKLRSAFLLDTITSDYSVNSVTKLLSELSGARFHNEKRITSANITSLTDWWMDEYSIKHRNERFFSVIGVNVEISNREVVQWSQPMIKPAQPGLCAFICRYFHNVLHFAMQLLVECGNLDVVEFAPTVQCLDDDYRTADPVKYPFIEYFLKAEPSKVVYDTILSEEGGRFFKDQNRYMIVLADDNMVDELPPGYVWMSLTQIQEMIGYSNLFNIQSRNLISTIEL